jgi:hypothetical protein
VCHRCFAQRHQYLDTAYVEVKTIRKVRARVEFAAAGGHLKGSRGTRVVRWDPDGRNVTAGPVLYILYVLCQLFTLSALSVLYVLFFSNDLQAQDFMILSGKKPAHICSSTHSG